MFLLISYRKLCLKSMLLRHCLIDNYACVIMQTHMTTLGNNGSAHVATSFNNQTLQDRTNSRWTREISTYQSRHSRTIYTHLYIATPLPPTQLISYRIVWPHPKFVLYLYMSTHTRIYIYTPKFAHTHTQITRFELPIWTKPRELCVWWRVCCPLVCWTRWSLDDVRAGGKVLPVGLYVYVRLWLRMCASDVRAE